MNASDDLVIDNEDISDEDFKAALGRALKAPRERSPKEWAGETSPDLLLCLALMPAFTAENFVFIGLGDPTHLNALSEQCLLRTFETVLLSPRSDQPSSITDQTAERPKSGTPSLSKRLTLYEMVPSERRAILSNQIVVAKSIGKARRQIIEIGMALRRQDAPEMPSLLGRWAHLAQHLEMTADLFTVVGALVSEPYADYHERVDVRKWQDHGAPIPLEYRNYWAQQTADTINGWIEAARFLTPLLIKDEQDSLGEILAKARRSIELLFHKEKDEEALQTFFRRAEQIDQVKQLFPDKANETDLKNDPWALHIIGMGGVGKTMLVRYIVNRLAPEQDYVVARVDFDHLNPDYPEADPGQLLATFTRDLETQTSNTKAQELFAESQRSFRVLYELLRNERGRSTPPPLERDEFEHGFEDFVAALRCLEGRHVLLILDTCEELAKYRADGIGMPPSVQATFDILERIHREIPTLRVLFSGRRPLARSGAGWELEHADRSPLPPRDYLRLYEIRGFTVPEARTYLTEHRGVRPGLQAAVIQASQPEAGRAIQLKKVGSEPDDIRQRCNPYDLWLYANWATEKNNETLLPDAIRQAKGPAYIQYRVIDRLENRTLERALPLIALLGSVTRQALADLLVEPDDSGHSSTRAPWQIPKIEFDRIFGLLAQLDITHWRTVTFTGGTSGSSIETLDIDPRLLPRLRDFYQESGDTDRVIEPVAAFLRQATLTGDLSQADVVPLFGATCRVLEQTSPVEAARWWEKIEDRLWREKGASWVDSITALLLTEDASSSPLPSMADISTGALQQSLSLLPALAAARASALLAQHIRQSGNPGNLIQEARQQWETVGANVERYPLSEKVTLLRFRAAVGRLCTTHALGYPPDDAEWTEFAKTFDAIAANSVDDESTAFALLASLVVMLDIVAENSDPMNRMERRQFPATVTLEQWRSLGSTLPPNRLADTLFVRLLEERLGLLQESQRNISSTETETQSLIKPILVELIQSKDIPTGGLERYIALPADIWSRIALELLYIGIGNRDDLQRLEDAAKKRFAQNRGSKAAAPRSMEEDRLQSALLRRAMDERLSASLLPKKWQAIAQVAAEQEKNRTGVVYCYALQRTPPYFSTLAELAAKTGQLTEAVTFLRNIRDNTATFGTQVVTAANRALLRLSERFRLCDEQIEVPTDGLSGTFQDTVQLWMQDAASGRQRLRRHPAIELPPREDTEMIQTLLHHTWRTYSRITSQTERNRHRPLVTSDLHFENTFSFLPYTRSVLTAKVPTPKSTTEMAWILDQIEGGINGGYRIADLQRWSPPLDEAGARIYVRRSVTCERILPDKDSIKAADIENNEVFDRLEQRIGGHKLAEIFFEEASALALRRPSDAVSLFSEAARRFASSGDAIGSLWAKTLRVLCLFEREGHESARTSDANEAAAASRKELTELQKTISKVPGWERFAPEKWGECLHDEKSAVPEFLDAFDSTQAPLAVRLLRATVLLCSQEDNKARYPALLLALDVYAKGRYVVQVEGKQNMPPELLLGHEKISRLTRIERLRQQALRRQEEWQRLPKWELIGGALTVILIAVVLSFVLRAVAVYFSSKILDSLGYILLYSVVVVHLFYSSWSVFKWRNFGSRLKSISFIVAMVNIYGMYIVTPWGNQMVESRSNDWFFREQIDASLFGIWNIILGEYFALWYVTYPLFTFYVFVFPYTAYRCFLRWRIKRCCPTVSLFTKRSNSDGSGVGINIRLTFSKPLKLFRIGDKSAEKEYSLRLPETLMRDGKTMSESASSTESTSPLSVAPSEATLVQEPSPLRRLYQKVWGQQVVLTVLPEVGTHGPCWEDRLTETVTLPPAKRPGRQNGYLPFHFRRTTPEQNSRRAKISSTFTVTVCTPATEWGPRMEIAWRSGVQDAMPAFWRLRLVRGLRRSAFNIQSVSGPGRASNDESVRIVHMIGVVEQEATGDSFRFSSGVAGIRVGKAYSPHEIVRHFPMMTVCVLQSQPETLTEALILPEETRLERLREFAASLHTLGIPVVVVLPPVSLTQSCSLIRSLARGIARRERNGLPFLLETIATLREQLGRNVRSLPFFQADDILNPNLPRPDWELLRQEARPRTPELESGATDTSSSPPPIVNRWKDLSPKDRPPKDQPSETPSPSPSSKNTLVERLRTVVDRDTLIMSPLTALMGRYLPLHTIIRYYDDQIRLFSLRLLYRNSEMRAEEWAGHVERVRTWNRRILERVFPRHLRSLSPAEDAKVGREHARAICLYAPEEWDGRHLCIPGSLSSMPLSSAAQQATGMAPKTDATPQDATPKLETTPIHPE